MPKPMRSARAGERESGRGGDVIVLPSLDRRCPKCGAKPRECGFMAPAMQAFEASGQAGGVTVFAELRAACILCGSELPWTVEQLSGKGA